MTSNLPDYSAIEPSDETPATEYGTHERRAALLREIVEARSPFAINQARLADRYGVHRSTVSRDMDRLRESIDENLGTDAELTSKVIFETVLEDLLDADDWRATKAAFDATMDWNDWLADTGRQHREPDRSELDVDVRSRHSEVVYRVVREGDGEPLPTTTSGDNVETVDYEELGFTSGPAGTGTGADGGRDRKGLNE